MAQKLYLTENWNEKKKLLRNIVNSDNACKHNLKIDIFSVFNSMYYICSFDQKYQDAWEM